MRSYKRPKGARKALLKIGEFNENNGPYVRDVHAACACTATASATHCESRAGHLGKKA